MLLLIYVMKQPVRVLIETSVYGILAEESPPVTLGKIGSSENVIIYGFTVVRKELRDTPKNLVKKGRKFRITLLNSYDALTQGHYLQLTKLVEVLAEEYLKNYTGGISKKKLRNDFLIVACATFNNLDILVSEDNHSMFSTKAIEAYNKVNMENGLKAPNFYSIKQLAQLL
ncbi:MAG: hypothetical protein HYW50_04680 [Candidatus Diapherotrites archaeon]|nr:hypothetical protein [Candidatus Diapherotrites archaeon]